MDTKKDTTASRFRDLRKGMDLTQADTAEALGISLALYSRIENGHIEIPSTHVLIAAADLFCVSVDYLLCREDSASNTGLSPEALQVLTADLKETKRRKKNASAIQKCPDDDTRMLLHEMTRPDLQDGIVDVLNFLLSKKRTAPGCFLDLIADYLDTPDDEKIQGLQDNSISIQRRRGYYLSGSVIKSGMIFYQIQETLREYKQDYQRQSHTKKSPE